MVFPWGGCCCLLQVLVILFSDSCKSYLGYCLHEVFHLSLGQLVVHRFYAWVSVVLGAVCLFTFCGCLGLREVTFFLVGGCF